MEKSAKAMKSAIIIEICLKLFKLNISVKIIVDYENASALKQICEQLEALLNEITK